MFTFTADGEGGERRGMGGGKGEEVRVRERKEVRRWEVRLRERK